MPAIGAGGIDIPLRLADLEEDGVAAEVIYPQGIFKAFASPDTGYQRALTSLYNDWYHEIFGEHTDRFAVSALLPMVDISTAMDEAEGWRRMGYRSLSVPLAIPLLPYNHPAYEPFWATVEELQVPVAFHVFTYGTTGKAERRRPAGRARGQHGLHGYPDGQCHEPPDPADSLGGVGAPPRS